MVAQALCELTEVLPTTDVDRRNGLNLCRRMWICRHDPEETNRQLAEKYVAYFFAFKPQLRSTLLLLF